MIFDDFEIDLIKCFHKYSFIKLSQEVTFLIVFVQLGQQGSEFDSLVAILDVFE
jgi:hypothetical protein